MPVTAQTKSIVLMRSGGRCGLCNVELITEGVESDKPVGEFAHIEGNKPGTGSKASSKRYNPTQTQEERDGYQNIFYLCPTCHTAIDKDDATYTTEYLKAKKVAHESKIEKAIKQTTLELSYFEIEHTCRHLIQMANKVPEETLQLIQPKDKINKNNLSNITEGYLRVGIIQSSQIIDFFNTNSEMDYSSRVRAWFVKNYTDLKDGGLSGDELFFVLWERTANQETNPKYYAAALSLLSYYFYLCEVFEK